MRLLEFPEIAKSEEDLPWGKNNSLMICTQKNLNKLPHVLLIVNNRNLNSKKISLSSSPTKKSRKTLTI